MSFFLPNQNKKYFHKKTYFIQIAQEDFTLYAIYSSTDGAAISDLILILSSHSWLTPPTVWGHREGVQDPHDSLVNHDKSIQNYYYLPKMVGGNGLKNWLLEDKDVASVSHSSSCLNSIWDHTASELRNKSNLDHLVFLGSSSRLRFLV